MKGFSFKSYLTSNLTISEEEVATLLQQCTIKEFNKGDFLVRENEFCKQVYFVEEGLLRQFFMDDSGKEHILQFAPENWFAADRESFYFNQPSKYFIQALEPTKVAIMDDAYIKNLEATMLGFRDFNNRLLHNHIRALQNRIVSLLSETAEKRYLNFIQLYPDVMLRVPLTMIASYLGITPESLSRVRKDLANKPH